MKKQSVITCLFIMLVVVMMLGAYQIYAFLTYESTIEHEFEIAEITGTVYVDGAEYVSVVSSDDLAYFDYEDFKKSEKYDLITMMSSEVEVEIKYTSNFNTRTLVRLPKHLDNLGICYIVMLENEEFSSSTIDFTNVNTNLDFRNKLDSYNESKLKSLYELNVNAGSEELKSFKFKVLIWGDYYSLSDAEKPNYLDKQYQLNVTAKIVQAIDEYGGTLDYEND